MAVRIRLTRMGKKKQPSYRLVVMDGRRPRDGKYIEQIGRYDPRQDPSIVEIDNERALDWLRKGAQPSDRARKLLEISGAWVQFKVDQGEIHTIPDQPAAVEDIDAAGADAEAAPEATPDGETAEAEDTSGEEAAGEDDE
jgi:small subunit ribosomal protein S16